MKRTPPGRHPRRSISPREAHQVIRVLTEGRVTERSYLKILGRQNPQIRVDFAESGMAPLSLVERAREHAKLNKRTKRRTGGPDFDEIWCVFDVDEAIGAARRRAVALDKRHEDNGSEPNWNPSTNAWEIAQAVLQLD